MTSAPTTAAAATAEATMAVLKAVAMAPFASALSGCRTRIEMASEIPKDVSHDVACVPRRAHGRSGPHDPDVSSSALRLRWPAPPGQRPSVPGRS